MNDYDGATLYGAAAEVYDLDTRPITRDDIPFYLERASRTVGDVLELACGTGRITIPLAKAGHRIWGIDLSQQMLAQFRAKMTGLPEEVRGRITSVCADICQFDLDREFSLVIIPFNSFLAITNENGQRNCLASVYRHLSTGGRFILDVFRPRGQIDDSWIQPETTDWEAIDPISGFRVRRAHINHRVDTDNQIVYSDQIYYAEKADGTEERVLNPISLKYYYDYQLRTLLRSSGFDIVEELGYFDGRRINQGPEMIFVCAKADL